MDYYNFPLMQGKRNLRSFWLEGKCDPSSGKAQYEMVNQANDSRLHSRPLHPPDVSNKVSVTLTLAINKVSALLN